LATPTKSKAKKAVDIVRDATFVRAIADRAIVLNLGRDVELAYLQIGPTITSMEDHGDREQLNMNPSVTESVRLRMHWSTAIDSAMLILNEASEAGKLNNAELLKYVQENFQNEKSESED
jgi:hypothetical protein